MMMFKSNVLTAPAAAVLILVLLLQQSACHASAIHMDTEEPLGEESEVTKTGSGDAEEDNKVFSSGCHRVSKIVNFQEDLGWTYVRRPRRVDIGECVGYCSLVHSSNTHQRLTTLLANNPREPCCVPSEYEPQNLVLSLYSHDLQRIARRIERIDDMVVKSCECR